MKTVIEVVNFYKAGWPPCFCNQLKGVEDTYGIRYEKRAGFFPDHIEGVIYICTYEQFIKCVDELSKAEWMNKPTPSTDDIVDGNSRQARISNIGNVLHNISCSTVDEDEQNELGGHASYLWDLSVYFGKMDAGCSVSSQDKPAYTQAMMIDGVLPNIGMPCRICIFTNDNGESGHIEFSNDIGHLFMYDDNNLCDFYLREDVNHFKPLTPAIELIDGKAYQFDIEFVGTVCGVYYKGNNELNGSEDNYEPEFCANIKLLTV